MKKLVDGILEFRRNVRPGYREMFARLALGQTPDALFIACSDSRVVPNLFASTNPGDLFVVRNVGNMVPRADSDGICPADRSSAAALEFSLLSLEVKHVVVCGHSECGAMRAVMEPGSVANAPNLEAWLRHGRPALDLLHEGHALDPALKPHNQLSQLNVLQQIRHLLSYPIVRSRIEAGTLRLHGWWFDIASADVFAFDESARAFVLITGDEIERSVLPVLSD